MSKFPLFSLRSRAIFLVLLAIFPLLVLTLYSYFDRRHDDIREVQREELMAVRNLATIHETVLDDLRKLLITLAQLPQVQRCDRDACNALFAELLKNSPQIFTLVAVDSEGRLFASAPVAPGPFNVTDRQWFQKVSQTRDLVIGQTIVGRISGKYGHNLAYPILDGESHFRGALTTQLNLEWLGDLLAKNDFPPTTSMTLNDSNGKVIFRYPDPQKYIGKTVPAALVKAMTGSDEGMAAGIGLDGDMRLFAFTRLPPPLQEIRLTVGFPMDWALGPANRALWHNLIGLGLVAVFAMAAAWYGGDFFVVRPVKQLRVVTERLAAGDLTMRSGSDYTVGELGLLSHSFDQMADALQAREAALCRSEERLHLALNAAKAGVWEWDLRTNENFWSEELWCLYGLRPHSPKTSYEAWLQMIHPDDREKAEAAIKMAVAQSTGFDIEWRVQHQDGSIRWLMGRGQPQLDDQGRPKGYLGIVMDITKRKQAEEAMRESEARLRTLYETVQAGVILQRNNGEILHANQVACDILGMSYADLIGTNSINPIWQMVLEDGSPVPGEEHPSMITRRTGLPIRNVVRGLFARDQEKRRWLLINTQPIKDPATGEVREVTTTFQDITERQKAEENIRSLTHALMRAQEQERHKISLELHDTVAQELASLKICLENLRDNSPAIPAVQINSQLTSLLGILQQSLNSIRTLSYNLRPPNLKHLGLVQAIQMHCEEVATRTGLRIDFKAAGIEGKNLKYETAINLYRIVQEGLANVWRHARAENVILRLVASYPKIIVRLEDDGQGFKSDELADSNHLGSRMGLLGMKERVAFLGGEMHLESELKKGTRIKIEIPWAGEGHGPKEDSYS